MIVGIDASRIRSGGGVAHIMGIIRHFRIKNHDIKQIHIWSYDKLLNDLTDEDWLFKHKSFFLNKSLPFQLLWQAFILENELINNNCDILFSVDASSLCTFNPSVAISQDLLSYEPNIMTKYRYGFRRLRLIIILLVQNLTFQRASCVIFLSKYASQLIQKSTGRISNYTLIPHGIDDDFIKSSVLPSEKDYLGVPRKILYVSNAAPYKNQLQVIDAVSLLIEQGFDISLELVGGGYGSYQKLINSKIVEKDPEGSWLKQYDFVSRENLTKFLSNADIFIFASSCENLPVTLLEGMIFSLPIVCSNRGPMPEVLKDGGIYFNPNDVNSIVFALKKVIKSEKIRSDLAKKARSIGSHYTWKKCSYTTFSTITKLVNYSNQRNEII